MSEDELNVQETAYQTGLLQVTGFFRYVKAVADDLGMEYAFELMQRSSIADGKETGEMMKQQGVPGDVRGLGKVMLNMFTAIGYPPEKYEESDDEVRFTFGRCYIYDAAVAAGLPPEKVCQHLAPISINEMVKTINPDLGYAVLKCRASADGHCEEVMGKGVKFSIAAPE